MKKDRGWLALHLNNKKGKGLIIDVYRGKIEVLPIVFGLSWNNSCVASAISLGNERRAAGADRGDNEFVYSREARNFDGNTLTLHTEMMRH